MAIGPRLDLRQSQALVMTPQLQQAIKLLQLSSLELAAYVETQIEQNPLLEREETGDGGPERENDPAATVAGAADPPTLDEAVGAETLDLAEANFDCDSYDNLFDPDAGLPAGGAQTSMASPGRGGSFDETDGNLEEMVAGRLSLREHLMAQVAIDFADPVDRMIAALLIDLLDDAGYLTGDLESVAARLGCPSFRVEATLCRLQRLDPPGIFARSLAECLALQLADRGRLDATMRTLLDHLELVGRREWSALSKICRIDGETLGRRIAEIRSLDPKPALAFDDAVAQPLTPDVIVRPQAAGGWVVELNNDTLPRVLVNNRYYAQIAGSARSKSDKQYLTECLQSANWLVKSLHQRATTILKVTTEVVRYQQAFFVNGIRSLRPLVLRDIAEAVGMHESTVSRVTSNKFIATPRGIFELKYFFTHAVGSSQGDEAHSAAAVRHLIKGLIDAEKPSEVLSDDTIADLLQKDGIDIARRTVAKYREALGIPSSVLRRRQKCELG
jgi:RNA polymerase sigma-54 factor